MARPRRPRVCIQCHRPEGEGEGEVQLSARGLCRDCANSRIQANMDLMRQAYFGRQAFPSTSSRKPQPTPEILREAAAIVEAADAAAAQEEKLTHYAAVALAELGEDTIQELQATEEPVRFVRKNGCIWLKSGDKEHYLHL